MGVRAAKVAAPAVVVRIELDERNFAKSFVNRTQGGKQDRVVATDARCARSGHQDFVQLRGVSDRGQCASSRLSSGRGIRC